MMIDRHHAAMCATSAAWLEDIVALDDARRWVADGATSMSAWLAGRYGMARGTAREGGRVAEDVGVEEDVRDREGARLADALVGLVTSGSGGNNHSTVVVHTDVSVLARGSVVAETGPGAALADDTVRRLACDAVVEWTVEAA